jgi:hypothetical protein
MMSNFWKGKLRLGEVISFLLEPPGPLVAEHLGPRFPFSSQNLASGAAGSMFPREVTLTPGSCCCD